MVHSDPTAGNFPTSVLTPSEIKLQFRMVGANLLGTQGLPITVAGWSSTDLQTGTALPVTDLGGGLFEVAMPTGATPREFLQLKVDDPN